MDLVQQDINKRALKIAYSLALNSNCKRRQYGAVLVKNNRIIARGYNHTFLEGECRTCAREKCTHNEGSYENCPAVHAEVSAICNAHAKNIFDLKGTKLYLVGIEDNKKLNNVCPCHECKKILDKEHIIY